MSEPTPAGGFDVNQLLQLLQQSKNGGTAPDLSGLLGGSNAAPPPPAPPQASEPPQQQAAPEPPKEQKAPAAPKEAEPAQITMSVEDNDAVPPDGEEQEDAAASTGDAQPKAPPKQGDVVPFNPIADEIDAKAQANLAEKMPLFRFKNVSERLKDDDITFDQLRDMKSGDFAVFEEAKNVSWTVTYGKVVRRVADSAKTNIAAYKREIENSKDFKTALKSATDKNPDCILTPTVTMKSKGTAMPEYKGLFLTQDEAIDSDKVICMVPSRDGKLYQLRKMPMGDIVSPIRKFPEADEVEAGFTPAFPLVPFSMIQEVIYFFRYYALNEDAEALVQIFWDMEMSRHVVAVPPQTVDKVAIHADLSGEEYLGNNERYVLCMDIHSHNTMNAFFSEQDDADELDDGVYVVMGKLDQYLPQVKARVCNGGIFVDIDPEVVLQLCDERAPDLWYNQVTVTRTDAKHTDMEGEHFEVSDDRPGEDRGAGSWGHGRTCCAALISAAVRACVEEESAFTDY